MLAETIVPKVAVNVSKFWKYGEFADILGGKTGPKVSDGGDRLQSVAFCSL